MVHLRGAGSLCIAASGLLLVSRAGEALGEWKRVSPSAQHRVCGGLAVCANDGLTST